MKSDLFLWKRLKDDQLGGKHIAGHDVHLYVQKWCNILRVDIASTLSIRDYVLLFFQLYQTSIAPDFYNGS